MKRSLLVCTVTMLCAAGTPVPAQDPLQTVRDLYAAAAYEDALAAVSRFQSERPQRELEEYRLFCLVALGRHSEAEAVVRSLVTADPLYTLDPSEVSPRVHEAFTRTRQQLLPELAQRLYRDARAAMERKDLAGAIERFERVLRTIDAVEAVPAALGELRELAAGFLDLSRALPLPAPPEPRRAADAPSRAPDPVTAVEAVTATPPTALKQELPRWVPPDAISRRTAFKGAVSVDVGPDGRVRSAHIVRSVHPVYDRLLLRAVREWVYEPARRNDVPVGANITVEIDLKPPPE